MEDAECSRDVLSVQQLKVLDKQSIFPFIIYFLCLSKCISTVISDFIFNCHSNLEAFHWATKHRDWTVPIFLMTMSQPMAQELEVVIASVQNKKDLTKSVSWDQWKYQPSGSP